MCFWCFGFFCSILRFWNSPTLISIVVNSLFSLLYSNPLCEYNIILILTSIIWDRSFLKQTPWLLLSFGLKSRSPKTCDFPVLCQRLAQRSLSTAEAFDGPLLTSNGKSFGDFSSVLPCWERAWGRLWVAALYWAPSLNQHQLLKATQPVAARAELCASGVVSWTTVAAASGGLETCFPKFMGSSPLS